MTYPPFKHFTLMEQTPTTLPNNTDRCKECGYTYFEHKERPDILEVCRTFTSMTPTTASDRAPQPVPRWICDSCDTKNFPLDDRCRQCGKKRKITTASDSATPLATDICEKCGEAYNTHVKVFNVAWCDWNDLTNEEKFTPSESKTTSDMEKMSQKEIDKFNRELVNEEIEDGEAIPINTETLAKLLKENERLQAEVAALKEENAKLKAELRNKP